MNVFHSGRSDWDDGRWEWEEAPRRDSQSNTSRHHHYSPSPMFVGASPDARLVSPWHTPSSTGRIIILICLETGITFSS